MVTRACSGAQLPFCLWTHAIMPFVFFDEVCRLSSTCLRLHPLARARLESQAKLVSERLGYC